LEGVSWGAHPNFSLKEAAAVHSQGHLQEVGRDDIC